MAHYSSLSPHKEKLPKNVIFHDFFKLLLGGLRWSCRYVEMFLGPLEGVLSLRAYFWLVSEPHVKWTFSAQILSLAQYMLSPTTLNGGLRRRK